MRRRHSDQPIPRLRYVVAGDGPEAHHLRDLVMSLGVRKNAKLLGIVGASLRTALYDCADAFVLPSHPIGRDVDGFGLVFLEAGYFGLPAIAGRGGGAAEAVEDNVTGLLCDGTNDESVQQALGNLLAKGSQRRRYGYHARIRARSMLWRERLQVLL